MKISSHYPGRLVGAVALLMWGGIAVFAQTATPDSDLSARDMFYSAKDMLVAQARPATKPVAKPATNSTGTASPKNLKVVSDSLGLRYSILRKSPGESDYSEVSPDTIFRAGDQIRLTVMSNVNGYLYIIQKGSSGTWGPLFPNPEINGGDNVVVAKTSYKIPEQGSFEMNSIPGDERLFFLLKRNPEPDFEKLTMSLRRKDSATATSAIDDRVINRIRDDLQARDLVFTKAGGEDANDKGVYVVNKSAAGNPNSEVVADVKLSHK